MSPKRVVLLLALALAALSAAGCGSSGAPLPNGGKGLLGSQPLHGNPGTGRGAAAANAASMKASEKSDPP